VKALEGKNSVDDELAAMKASLGPASSKSVPKELSESRSAIDLELEKLRSAIDQ